MSNSVETITELLARVRAGDEAALAELLRQYAPKIRLTAHYLLRPILRRYLDSIDVAQSVQCDLMRGLRRGSIELTDLETFLALAVTVVRRKVARHWRHLQREHLLRFGPSDGNGPSANHLAPVETPADPAQVAQQSDDFQAVWHRLDSTERRLIELRLQGYTTEEAAATMGLAANVLRVRLSRLRKRLREQGHPTEGL
jgi:RNA polymerase sigma-70 factor (ECF subfamily)